ncbi:MAG: N-6 DNA methylase [bacterium]
MLETVDKKVVGLGIIHDPACGSGGMFVQTGYFIKSHTNKQINEAVKIYGTELKTNNSKLAKMNLAIHGIEGKIIESNTFYSDPHNLIRKCDFVMANPPFNVNKVDKNKDYVKEDTRLPFGLPKCDNGNYLWIQYFYSYLNEKGRAGFVMASSATDAGNSEKLIRQKLIETRDVDVIVSVGNNFFYTRSLPCHLWFFDKGKQKENKDKILMIDARSTFRKVTTTINDFSPEQMEGLTAIVKAYRGEKVDFTNNEWLKEHFPNGKYEDIEGLCKITNLEEIKENDYSLTPGRYVGYSIQIDEDFDYKGRMREIQKELAILNTESVGLMGKIQGFKI